MTIRFCPGVSRFLGAARACALAAFAFALVIVLSERTCRAASKEECLDAHAHGQDLRDKGLFTRAKQAFLTCAQRSCPAMVQADCAHFGEELDRLVPSLTFAARDARGADLSDTEVFVDDVLVATRLDDGKSYDLDPGRHTIRFEHDQRNVTLTPILNQGEKGRVLVAAFPSRTKEMERRNVELAPPAPASKRSALPWVVAGLGAAALVTGGVLTAVGYAEVPSGCSVGARECAAAPGDPSFEQAHRAMTLANVGLATAISGGAVMIGGIVWYVAQPASRSKEVGRAERPILSPWVARSGGGAAIAGSF